MRTERAQYGIFKHAIFHRQRRDLKGAGQSLAGALIGLERCDVFPIEEHLAAIGCQRSAYLLDQGRLAGTIGADDGVDFALPEVDGNILIGLQRREGPGDAPCFKHRE